MGRSVFNRCVSWLLVFVFVFSAMSVVNITYSHAAQVDLQQINVGYANNMHIISLPVNDDPQKVAVWWDDEEPFGPDGELPSSYYEYTDGILTIRFPDQTFRKNHIFRIRIKVTTEDSVVHDAEFLYLPGIDFTGRSFGVMVESEGSIIDGGWNPPEDQYIVSGRNPVIEFTWYAPTIYVEGAGDVPITNLLNGNALGNILGTQIDEIRFLIDMEVGRNWQQNVNNPNSKYTCSLIVDADGNLKWSVAGNTPQMVDHPAGSDRFTIRLDKNNNIQSGTEYQNVRLYISFRRSGDSGDIRTPSILKTASGFLQSDVRNEDINDPKGPNIPFDRSNSIYTPLEFRIKKVDENLILIEFDELKTGNYPELYYQIQYHSAHAYIYNRKDLWPQVRWVNPKTEKVREIIPYNPGDYIAVVLYPNKDASSPLGASLSLKSEFLDTITGDAPPPVPKNIDISVANTREVTMTVKDIQGNDTETKMLISDLKLSFDAPLAWQNLFANNLWNLFKNGGPGNYGDDIEYTFHILISAYRPDADVKDGETTKVGEDDVEVYVPVKQKRVLVIGKESLDWENGRLVAIIPGDKLFWDYVAEKHGGDPDISFENGPGYPDFLVPNTIYYAQIITSRYKDNAEINADKWEDGLSEGLKKKMSYLSPIVSFTTHPLDRKPVPAPNIEDIKAVTTVDSDGTVELTGINVMIDRLLEPDEWQRYTTEETGLVLKYEVHVSQSPDFNQAYRQTEEVNYDVDADAARDPVTVFIDSSAADIKPNTTYYFRVIAYLYSMNEDPDNPITWSDASPVKSFTTPKIAPKDVDDSERRPSAPTDLAIAKDAEGQELVTDTQVVLTWTRMDKDVVYELICTSNGNTENYADNAFNRRLIETYDEIASGDVVVIDPEDPNGILEKLGFRIVADDQIIMPIEGFLKPNTLYYFSLRAVRKDGKGEPSIWVTLPVTTKLVKAPVRFEAVRDIEVGFNIECKLPGTDTDSMEVYMKKSGQPDRAYTRLLRSQYTVVRDGNTYYFRVRKLEPNTVYHFRIYNKAADQWYVYDEKDGSGYWDEDADTPIPARTRDTFHEVEVRWEGEDVYEYFLEIRSEKESGYATLTGYVHYRYDLPEEVDVYREKTTEILREGDPDKYVYYARISRRPVSDGKGNVKDIRLETNTRFFVRLWAEHRDGDDDPSQDEALQSLHVGPVEVRTDFDQDDYDREKEREELEDLYNMEADHLLQKLYWLVDSKTATRVRALVKGDMVSGLLQASPGSTVTIDFSEELANAAGYDILVPQKVLETIESNDSRLNLKMSGVEVTLNRGSVDLASLKQQALSGGAREAMLRLRIELKSKSDTALPRDTKLVSGIYDVSISAVGSRRTYEELATMIYDILMEPEATGPFKYGIFDRELDKVLEQLDKYSYRSQIELKDMIRTVMKSIESELSRYLRDILDGGSGLSASLIVDKPVLSFQGGLGMKLAYQPESGRIVPYVNYQASKGWTEVPGSSGFYLQYIVFRANAPGEYAVLAVGSISVSPGSPFEEIIRKLGAKYDLKKVFGNTTIYPGDPLTGQQALVLYAVLIGKEGELTGLTPNQKVSVLGIGDVLGIKELTGYLDNQSALALSVRLYCAKTGINPSALRPAKTIIITNASQINNRLYNYVTVGIDLGFATLRNNQFDATGRSTIGQMLDMVAKVLEKLGEI